MGYSQDNGYIPATIEDIMLSIMDNINTQFGTAYTAETFLGTNFYKYFYALAQELEENEVKTSEIFLKLQQYFIVTNERISRPVVTNPGLIEKLSTEGYVASVKPMIEADAGEINICVDVDDGAAGYDDVRLDVCTIISLSTVAGAVTMGTESETIVLSNGQSFDFKYHLPDRKETLLRLTITLSQNNQVVVGNPDTTKVTLMSNISERYSLGKNFEPERYFGIVDAPWAESVLLEWSINGGDDYFATVFEAEFDELFEITLENIELIEA